MRFARSTLLTIALALMVSASPSSAKCRFDVPESTMKSAHIVYTGGPGFSPAPIQAQNILRIFVLLASDGCVVEHREWLARMRWERDFKDLFDNAIRWKRETLAKGAAHIYRLSGEYRNRPDANENQFDDLSYNLLQLASRIGHAKAKAELPNRRHPMDEPGGRAELRERIFGWAKKNHVWAQMSLARDYLYSVHLEKDPLKSYYWSLRAQANGADMSDKIRTVLPMLSTAEQLRVREWIARIIVPDP